MIELIRRMLLTKEQRELSDLLKGRNCRVTRNGLCFIEEFKIEPEMITPNVIRINTRSLREFLDTEEGKLKSGRYK